ncbi:hypothetical protein ABT160_13080 [Streptomyces sp. NPDC001941]|uniref:hypothetical protein n=1 Tax=Streptomyces sp. NPDC001941 TaxID=3154659 RepID=UPI0033318B2B
MSALACSRCPLEAPALVVLVEPGDSPFTDAPQPTGDAHCDVCRALRRQRAYARGVQDWGAISAANTELAAHSEHQ